MFAVDITRDEQPSPDPPLHQPPHYSFNLPFLFPQRSLGTLLQSPLAKNSLQRDEQTTLGVGRRRGCRNAQVASPRKRPGHEEWFRLGNDRIILAFGCVRLHSHQHARRRGTRWTRTRARRVTGMEPGGAAV